MKIQNECNCCGAIYAVLFTEIPDDLDPDMDQDADEDSEYYPEFCPFCGSHESDGDDLDNEDE